MVYETRVRSVRELFEVFKSLAADEGVRVEGKYHGENCAVFVTRHSGRYAIWIRPTRQKISRKGGVNVFRDFREFGALKKFLLPVISEPLGAYVY